MATETEDSNNQASAIKIAHPGDIASDYIARRKMVRVRLANRIGVDRGDFSKFLKGKKKLNTTNYVQLAVILQIPRDTFVMQQAKWDYAQSVTDSTLAMLIRKIEQDAQTGDLDRELTMTR